MKIIAVGRNYSEHAKELGNQIPEEPVLFIKPDTALLKDNRDFYYPKFTKDLHYEVEIVLRIAKEGKYIHPNFAADYYDAIALGIDFTARDLQSKQKEKGLPWEIAKAFDHSAPISVFFPKTNFPSLHNIHFSLQKNQEIVQQGVTGEALFSFEEIICYASKFFTLKKGDIIFTGTPPGVGSVQIGDFLEGYIEEQKVLSVHIK